MSHSTHGHKFYELERKRHVDRIQPKTAHSPQVAGATPTSQEFTYRHHMSKGDKARFLVLRTLGNFLLLISLYGVIATFGPTLSYEVKYQIVKMRGIKYTVAAPNYGSSVQIESGPTRGFGDIIAGEQSQILVPPDTSFSIIIPKLGATARIWPNVDPTSEEEFLPKLKSGVAHAKGSVFPGMQGNVYLFAHSTDNFWDVGRYNAIFYLLKDLSVGDDITVFFENKRFNYKVRENVVKEPEEVDLLIHSQIPGKEQLILQTCWPPGTTWKRLYIIAEPLE